MIRNRLIHCAAGLMAAGTATVHAQDATEEKGTLQEVIVTAERREESLQKTAIAVTALDSAALQSAGVSQPTDLNKLVPGLGIAQGASSTQVYLRGVGNYGTNALADPAVAFNMDQIYLARFSGITGNFYDLERIEVLKGPQGTLYGRNATGGAINIVTRKPVDQFQAGANLELGDYSLVKASGYVNIPVNETLAFRFAAQRSKRDGYQTDGYDDEDSVGARIHALYKPNDDFSLLVTGTYNDLGGMGPVHVPTSTTGFVDNSNPWRGLSETAPVALATAKTGLPAFLGLATLERDNGKLDVTVKGLTAQIDTNVGIGTLTLVGNYMDTDNNSKNYGPGFLYWQDDTAKQKTVEARLSGESGALRWVGGAYYFKEDQTTHYWVDQGLGFNQTGVNLDQLDDETKAVFTQLTYSMTDRLRLTGGLRYTDEGKSQQGTTFNRQGAAPNASCVALTGGAPVTINSIVAVIPVAGQTGQSYTSYTIPGVGAVPITYCMDSMTGKIGWGDTSWKAGADFDLNPDSMLYANVSRGFKAGGFFAAGDHADTGNRFDPETLIAYAVGSKNRFHNRVQLNGEAFFWDYRNHQESYLAPLYNGSIPSFGFITQKADAHIYGLDLELNALITDDDEVAARGQYLHAEYTDANFRLARPGEFSSGAGTSPPTTACKPTLLAQGLYNINCSGQQMPRSPDFSVSAEYRHTFRLSGGGRIVPGINARYSASYWAAVDYHPLQKQDAFTMWGADVMYESPSSKFTVTAYGRNLSNEVIYTNAFMYPATSVAMVQLDAPRTYGALFTVRF